MRLKIIWKMNANEKELVTGYNERQTVIESKTNFTEKNKK